MNFLKKCGRSCIKTIIGSLIILSIAYGISSYIQLWLKADVMEDFIQDYFELTDQNTSEMSKILLKYRDETKYLKKYRKAEYPDTNNFMDVINELSKKKMEDLEHLENILKNQLKTVENLKDIIKEDSKELNKKFNTPVRRINE